MCACFALCLLLLTGPTLRAQAPPRYKVDPSWPKTLPNNWTFANMHGIVVDKNDHIWALTVPRNVPADKVPAPSVTEFDTGGNLLKSWGGPGHVPDWTIDEHGLAVDSDGNVWIAGNWFAQFKLNAERNPDQAALPWDRQALKLSGDGKLLLEIGHPSKQPMNNQDTTILGAPNALTVDNAAHEVYIADGAMNRRVVVYNSSTGAFKRGWGAYGMPLAEIDNGRDPAYDPAAPPLKRFRGSINCVAISADGLVYVCDRGNDRIQVFTKQGKFLKEFRVRPETMGTGSTWAVAFSHGPKQKYMFVGDGANNVVWILNRDDGSMVGQFGGPGREPGQFQSLQCVAVDSQGNVYTGEVTPGSRIQKFVLEQ
jgi:hypothetical protein